MTIERQQFPDVLLERYLAGDLAVEDQERVQAACREHPGLQTRLEELAADRRAFLAETPPVDFARKVVDRLAMGRPAEPVATAPRRTVPRWWAWVLAPSAAAAVALAITFTVTRMSSDEAASFLLEDPAPAAAPTAAPDEAAVRNGAAAAHEVEGLGAEAEMRELPPGEQRKARSEVDSKRDKKKKRSAPAAKPASRPSQSETPPPPQAPAAGVGGAVLDAVTAVPEAEPVAPQLPSQSRRAARVTGAVPRERSSSAVQRTVASRARGLQPCLRASDDVPAGAYTLQLAWEITPAGRVEKARWLQPKDLAGTDLARCVLDRLRAWRFPEAAGSTTIDRLPLRVQVE
jgi:hypothetical protein